MYVHLHTSAWAYFTYAWVCF